MNRTITFVVNDNTTFKVGDVFNPNGLTRRYQVTKVWINLNNKLEYEAKCIDLNRAQLRRRIAMERKAKT